MLAKKIVFEFSNQFEFDENSIEIFKIKEVEDKSEFYATYSATLGNSDITLFYSQQSDSSCVHYHYQTTELGAVTDDLTVLLAVEKSGLKADICVVFDSSKLEQSTIIDQLISLSAKSGVNNFSVSEIQYLNLDSVKKGYHSLSEKQRDVFLNSYVELNSGENEVGENEIARFIFGREFSIK